jgi:hypothetical protein
VWKEVTIESIETSAGVGGCRKGNTRWKLSNSSAFVAQSTSMIKKKNFVRLVLG